MYNKLFALGFIGLGIFGLCYYFNALKNWINIKGTLVGFKYWYKGAATPIVRFHPSNHPIIEIENILSVPIIWWFQHNKGDVIDILYSGENPKRMTIKTIQVPIQFLFILGVGVYLLVRKG